MLKLLVKIRLTSIFNAMFRQNMRKDGRKSKVAKILLAIAFVYLGICLLALIGVLCYMIAGALANAGLGWLYHAVVGLMAVLFCFVGSVFLAQSQIFHARDNELLLSMPVPPRTIVASRLLSFLLLNYLYTAIVMVPAAVVYAGVMAPGTMFYIGYLVGFLLLPLLSMTFTCAIGYAITLLTSRMRRKNLVTGVAMIVFFLAFMFLYMNLTRYAMALIQNGAAIGDAFRRALPPFYSFGMGVEGSPLHVILTAVWCAVPFFLVYVLLSRSFQKLATTNRGAAKVKYVAREMHVKSPRAALLQKELGRIFGMPLYLFNCAIGGALALVLGIVLLIKGPDLIQSFAALYGMGSADMLIPFLLIAASFCAAMTCTSAPSISLEGPYLWILKANPVSTGDLFFSKVMSNILIGAVPLLLADACMLIALPMETANAALLVVLPLLVQIFIALLGLTLNLMMPRFDWVSAASVVKQSGSVMGTVFGGLGLIALPTLAYALWLRHILSFAQFGLLACLLLALACGALILYLCRGGRRRFEAL